MDRSGSSYLWDNELCNCFAALYYHLLTIGLTTLFCDDHNGVFFLTNIKVLYKKRKIISMNIHFCLLFFTVILLSVVGIVTWWLTLQSSEYSLRHCTCCFSCVDRGDCSSNSGDVALKIFMKNLNIQVLQQGILCLAQPAICIRALQWVNTL